MSAQKKNIENRFADYVKLKDLTRGSRDPNVTFETMAQYLADFGREAIVRVLLKGHGDEQQPHAIQLSKNGAHVTDRVAAPAALEIVTTRDVWLQIASGSLSPFEAFFQHRLRLTGSMELAVALVHQLRGSGTRSLIALRGIVSYLNITDAGMYGTRCEFIILQPDGTHAYAFTTPGDRPTDTLWLAQVELLGQAYAARLTVCPVLDIIEPGSGHAIMMCISCSQS